PMRCRSSCAAPGVAPSAAAMSAETWPLMKLVIDAGVVPIVAASPGLPLPWRSSSSMPGIVVPAVAAMPAKLMDPPVDARPTGPAQSSLRDELQGGCGLQVRQQPVVDQQEREQGHQVGDGIVEHPHRVEL